MTLIHIFLIIKTVLFQQSVQWVVAACQSLQMKDYDNFHFNESTLD